MQLNSEFTMKRIVKQGHLNKDLEFNVLFESIYNDHVLSTMK